MKKLGFLLLLTIALLALCATASAYTYDGYTEAEFAALDKTTVIKSPDSPTGYLVTFRYVDKDAERVRLYGEWCYSNPADIDTQYAPEQWKPGMVGFSLSYGTNVEMVKDAATGIWSYTVPLPNGLYGYRFYVGGTAAEVTDFTDAKITWDPTNLPTNIETETGAPMLEGQGGDYYISCVYVPFDAEKQLDDYTVMAPRADEYKGKTSFIKLSDETVGEQNLTLYVPYNFDPARETPYKLFVVFHGGGGFYANWINNGAADNIMDNLIAQGVIEPDTILLMPDGSTLRFNGANTLPFFKNVVFPYLYENYNVSEAREDHAIAGLSAGTSETTYMQANALDTFKYFMHMSGGGGTNYSVNSYWALAEADVKILLCNALNDFAYTGMRNSAKAFDLFGIEYDYRLSDGGHQWYTWRRDLAYAIPNFLWK